jgi:hypothetical protein
VGGADVRGPGFTAGVWTAARTADRRVDLLRNVAGAVERGNGELDVIAPKIEPAAFS